MTRFDDNSVASLIYLLLWLLQCVLRVSYVDEHDIRLVKKSQKKSLQDSKLLCVQPRKVVTLQCLSSHKSSSLSSPVRLGGGGRSLSKCQIYKACWRIHPEGFSVHSRLQTFPPGGRGTPESSSVSAPAWYLLGLSSRRRTPATVRLPTSCLVQLWPLRSHPGPPRAAVLQEERRRLHRLLASVPAARVAPLDAGSGPPVPEPPVCPCRARPDHQATPQRLQAVHQLEVWGAG